MATIRLEEPGDRDAVRRVHTACFPTDAEARLVEALRRDRDIVVELVWEQEGVIDGHILFSRLRTDRDGVFAELGYVRPEDVPHIPVLKQQKKHVALKRLVLLL